MLACSFISVEWRQQEEEEKETQEAEQQELHPVLRMLSGLLDGSAVLRQRLLL